MRMLDSLPFVQLPVFASARTPDLTIRGLWIFRDEKCRIEPDPVLDQPAAVLA
jgi:hypothetical protein